MFIPSELPGFTFTYHSAREIPAQCLLAATILESQPLFEGSGSIVDTCKVIPLESHADSRIIDIFNDNATSVVGLAHSWHIHGFGRNNGIEDAQGNSIPWGLTQWLCEDFERCPRETLENAYQQVYEIMRNGWGQCDLTQHPELAEERDPAHFTLLRKQRALSEEDSLIRFLFTKFELHPVMSCWADFSGTISIWVHNDHLSRVTDIFGFVIGT